jgi:hypothetical protein
MILPKVYVQGPTEKLGFLERKELEYQYEAKLQITHRYLGLGGSEFRDWTYAIISVVRISGLRPNRRATPKNTTLNGVVYKKTLTAL